MVPKYKWEWVFCWWRVHWYPDLWVCHPVRLFPDGWESFSEQCFATTWARNYIVILQMPIEVNGLENPFLCQFIWQGKLVMICVSDPPRVWVVLVDGFAHRVFWRWLRVTDHYVAAAEKCNWVFFSRLKSFWERRSQNELVEVQAYTQRAHTNRIGLETIYILGFGSFGLASVLASSGK